MDLSFYLMNFPNAFAFLFHLGLQCVPGSLLSVLCCLPAALLLRLLWTRWALLSAEQKPASRFRFHCRDH